MLKDTYHIQSGKTKMVAHRGCSGLEKENSLAAFITAGNRTYYGIETDVHPTSDGKYMLMHDSDSARVAGVSRIIEESTAAEMEQIRLIDNDLGTTRSDLVVPYLKEYIHVCKKYEKTAVLELKNHMDPKHIAGILAEVEECGYLDQTVIICFDWENLLVVREMKPQQTIQFLTSTPFDEDEMVEKVAAHQFSLDIHQSLVTPSLIEKMHAKGLEVNAWTVNDPETAEKFVSWGIDYITSNIVE